MKCLVTGAGGQLADELIRYAPSGFDVHALDMHSMDITSESQVTEQMGSIRPQLVINAAAWTDVDGAERNAASAYAVNVEGSRLLAASCRSHSSRLFHVSTDFVFDGDSPQAYTPTDEPSPLNVYGQTKLEGEKAVLEILPEESIIIRTAWLYSSHGKNFLLTMLRLMTERDRIKVVCDQEGTPTSASSLARSIWGLLGTNASGVYHWTNRGHTTWHAFAQAIHDLARTKGILDHDVVVEPIPSDQWPTPARRPRRSILDISATEALLESKSTPWKDELSRILDELVPSGKQSHE